MRRTLLFSLLLSLPACSGGGKDDGSGNDDSGGGGVIDTDDRPGKDSDEPLPEGDAVQDNLRSGPGDFAYDLLQGSEYDRLVVEVDWVAGNEPAASALEELQDTIEELCNKPGGVEIILDDEIPPQGGPTWTYEAAEELELTWRDRYRDGEDGTAVVYYLYLDGNSEYDTQDGYVLGYAYHGSSLIMFKENIASAESGIPLGGLVEDTVIVHELGHLLGLVDNGIPMVEDHRDPDNGNHDINDECIMYWAAETSSIVDILGLGGALDFDDACRADIAAAGGKDTTDR